MADTDVPIAKALVAAASISFISTVFTRDAFFSLATFTAFWVFIFGQIFYGADSGNPVDSVIWVNYVLASVLMAAVVGVMLVKLLGTGRLVDVWLTRAPARLRGSAKDDWHIPVFILATASTFVATFFFTSIAIGPGVPVWPGGMVPSTGWSWAIAIAASVVTLALLVLALAQKRVTTKGVMIETLSSAYYFVAWLAVSIGPVLAWVYIDDNSNSLGVWSALIAFAATVIALGVGYSVERWQLARAMRETQENDASFASPYDGLYSGESGIAVALRVFVIALTHALIFVIGGLNDVADGTPQDQAARDVFWFPYLALYFSIAFLVFFVLYALIIFCTYADLYNKGKASETRAFARTRRDPLAGSEFAVRQPSPPAENKPRRRGASSQTATLRFV